MNESWKFKSEDEMTDEELFQKRKQLLKENKQELFFEAVASGNSRYDLIRQFSKRFVEENYPNTIRNYTHSKKILKWGKK